MTKYKRDYGSKRTVVINLRLSMEEYEDLERIAYSKNESKSDIMRDSFRQYSQRFWRYSDNFLKDNPNIMTVFDD